MKRCDKCYMLHAGKCDPAALQGPSPKARVVRRTSNPTLDKHANKPVSLDGDANSLVAELRAKIAELRDRIAGLRVEVVRLKPGKFDKTAYQREYMRKRRAAK